MIFYSRLAFAAVVGLTVTVSAAPALAQKAADLMKMIEIERPAEVRAQLRPLNPAIHRDATGRELQLAARFRSSSSNRPPSAPTQALRKPRA